jgi:hypothetical protein
MQKLSQSSFMDFYREPYWEEHNVPMNLALHIFGTIAGVALLIASVTFISPWWALAFPVVHVVPGLIGHRLFERAEAVGDARIFRTDVPIWWFVVANHMMTVVIIGQVLAFNKSQLRPLPLPRDQHPESE